MDRRAAGNSRSSALTCSSVHQADIRGRVPRWVSLHGSRSLALSLFSQVCAPESWGAEWAGVVTVTHRPCSRQQ